MKKITILLALISLTLVQAQNIAFDKLYGNSDQTNYFLGHYPVPGSDGLDIHWYGGVKFGTSVGDVMQISQNGNVGIGMSNPQSKLDVLGTITAGNNSGTNGINILSDRYNTSGESLLNIGSLKSSGSAYISCGIKADPVNGDSWISSNTVDLPKSAIKVGLDSFEYIVSASASVALNSPVITTNVFKITKFGNAALQGKLEAKEVKVTTTPTADFVFEEKYDLPKLEEVEKFILENKHLPEIASAKVMEKEGVNIGEFQIKLLQKIEELTLYTIAQNKLNKEQENQIKLQNQKIEKLEKLVEKFASEQK